MRNFSSGERGAILIVAIVIMMLISALAVGYFHDSVERNQRQQSDIKHMKAVLNADSAVDIWLANAAAEDVSSPGAGTPTWWSAFDFSGGESGTLSAAAVDAYTAWQDVTVGEGQFKAEAVAWENDGVDNDGDGSIDEADELGFYTVTGYGSVELDEDTDYIRTVEVLLRPRYISLLDYALLSDVGTTAGEKMESDSYNSSDGVYNQLTAGQEGSVCSNGFISIAERSDIQGDVKSSATKPPGMFTRGTDVITVSDATGGVTQVAGEILTNAGDIDIGKNVTVGENVGTSDGDITIGQSTINGNVDTSNGSIAVGAGGSIAGDASPGPGVMTPAQLAALQGFVGGSVSESDYGPTVYDVTLSDAPTADGFTDHTGGAGPALNNNADLIGHPFVTDNGDGTISINVPNNSVYSIPIGALTKNYNIADISVGRNATLQFNGKANMLVKNSLSVNQNAAFQINGDGNIGMGGNTGNLAVTTAKGSKFQINGDGGIGAQTMTLDGGFHISGTATIDLTSTFEVAANGAVIFEGGGILDSQNQVVVRDNGTVAMNDDMEWYIQNSLLLEKHAVVTNPTEDATMLLVSVYGNPSSVTFGATGNGQFVGAIYAPNANVLFDNPVAGPAALAQSFDVHGAIVANHIMLNKGANFHYDEALADQFKVPIGNVFDLLVERELSATVQ